MVSRDPTAPPICAELQPGDRVTFGADLRPGRLLGVAGERCIIEFDDGATRSCHRHAVHYAPTEATIQERALALRRIKERSFCICDRIE